MENARRQGGLFGPVLLIGLGILFLLSNLGLLTLDIGSLIARFWPLILIAIGLDLLLGRRSGLGGLIALGLQR
jgi:lia operon protein LiaF